MSSDTIEDLVDSLDWHEDQARQNEAVGLLVAAGDRLDLSLMLQSGSKSRWENQARVLRLVGYPRFRAIIPGMLEWLQDLNWPGSQEILQALTDAPKDELVSHVSKAVGGVSFPQ